MPMPTLMDTMYKATMTARRCQVKKKSAARAPMWKATTTVSVSQLIPCPEVAARPMCTAGRAGAACALSVLADPDACGVVCVVLSVAVKGDGAAGADTTVAMFGEDP